LGAEAGVSRSAGFLRQERRLRSLEDRLRSRRRALPGPQSFLELVGTGDVSDIQEQERLLSGRRSRVEGEIGRRESRRSRIEEEAVGAQIFGREQISSVQLQDERNLRPNIALREIQLQEVGLQEEREKRRRKLLSSAFGSPLSVNNLQRRQLTGA